MIFSGGGKSVPRNSYNTGAAPNNNPYSGGLRRGKKRQRSGGYVLGTPEPENAVITLPNAKCVDEHSPSDHDVMEIIGVFAVAFPVPEDCVRSYCVYLPHFKEIIYIKYGDEITHSMSFVYFKFADFLNQLFVRTWE